MDPNANLSEQRRIADRMIACGEDDHGECDCALDGERLAELVNALDEWITRGGFLPTSWRR